MFGWRIFENCIKIFWCYFNQFPTWQFDRIHVVHVNHYFQVLTALELIDLLLNSFDISTIFQFTFGSSIEIWARLWTFSNFLCTPSKALTTVSAYVPNKFWSSAISFTLLYIFIKRNTMHIQNPDQSLPYILFRNFDYFWKVLFNWVFKTYIFLLCLLFLTFLTVFFYMQFRCLISHINRF